LNHITITKEVVKRSDAEDIHEKFIKINKIKKDLEKFFDENRNIDWKK